MRQQYLGETDVFLKKFILVKQKKMHFILKLELYSGDSMHVEMNIFQSGLSC